MRKFEEGYFLEEAKKFRAVVKNAECVYVGGLVSRAEIDEVLNAGLEAVQTARALINQLDFVNRMRMGEERCDCDHTNYCIARIYSLEMQCHKHLADGEKLPPCLLKEIEECKKF